VCDWGSKFSGANKCPNGLIDSNYKQSKRIPGYLRRVPSQRRVVKTSNEWRLPHRRIDTGHVHTIATFPLLVVVFMSDLTTLTLHVHISFCMCTQGAAQGQCVPTYVADGRVGCILKRVDQLSFTRLTKKSVTAYYKCLLPSLKQAFFWQCSWGKQARLLPAPLLRAGLFLAVQLGQAGQAVARLLPFL
jgi:hypothetical protein